MHLIILTLIALVISFSIIEILDLSIFGISPKYFIYLILLVLAYLSFTLPSNSGFGTKKKKKKKSKKKKTKVRQKVREELSNGSNGFKKTSPRSLEPLVNILWTTNRKIYIEDNEIIDYGERAEKLTYGSASIRIPELHKLGKLERPFDGVILGFKVWRKGEIKEEKHFSFVGINKISRSSFKEYISENDTFLIYIHGFNNTFEEGLLRTAQIAWDTQFNGIPIAFSWPSKGTMLSYDYDRESALFSRVHLYDLLKMVTNSSEHANVYIIAHSMGNQIVLDAIAAARQSDPSLGVSEMILAAPDVDADVFKNLGGYLKEFSDGVTMYASSNDKALSLSMTKANGKRAGYVYNDGPLLIPGIDVIDVSAVGNDMFSLNHSDFASERSIIDDMGRLLNSGVRPPHKRTPQLRKVPELSNDPKYWKYPE